MSSCFGESNDGRILSERFSTEVEAVLSNKAHLASGVSALPTVFSVFSWVGSPEKVRHVW